MFKCIVIEEVISISKIEYIYIFVYSDNLTVRFRAFDHFYKRNFIVEHICLPRRGNGTLVRPLFYHDFYFTMREQT